MRACRTDKGVHAAMQVVSLKILVKDSYENVMSHLNSVLPKDVRICGVHPVSHNFNSKLHCDGRTYEYLLPTFMFKKSPATDRVFAEMDKQRLAPSSVDKNTPSERKSSSDVDSCGELDRSMVQTNKDEKTSPYPCSFALTADMVAEQSSFRLPPDELEKIRKTLNLFVGSHHFHNYTIKKASSDPSSRRQIWSFIVSDDRSFKFSYIYGVHTIILPTCSVLCIVCARACSYLCFV